MRDVLLSKRAGQPLATVARTVSAIPFARSNRAHGASQAVPPI